MPWRFEITAHAERDLSSLPMREREAIRAALTRLTNNPASVDLKKLAGYTDRWRLRVGRWRVILRLDNRPGLMSVLRVLPRDTAYRD